MRLTLHSDLAFRAMLFLAAAGEDGGTIPQIAAAYRISEDHLRKVAHELVRLGLIDSTRGRSGGLRLGARARELSIGAGHCGLQRIFGEAPKAWFEVLNRYTLADAVSGSRKLRDLLEIDGGPPAAGTSY